MKTNTERSRRVKKSVGLVLVLLAIAWGAGCGIIYSEMRKPPEEFGRFMTRIPAPVAFMAFPFETMWMRAREGGLRTGDPAPDFTLIKVHETEQVRLSQLNASQPVVLVFGSYT